MKTTIPSRTTTTCDACGVTDDIEDAFAGGHLNLVINPHMGLTGDWREADLCKSCTSFVLDLLEQHVQLVNPNPPMPVEEPVPDPAPVYDDEPPVTESAAEGDSQVDQHQAEESGDAA